MSTRAEPAKRDLERDWWLRAFAVFQAPRAVFAAMRDDSNEAASARAEPITAIVIMAGVSWVLSTPTYGRLLDNPERDGLLVAVFAFIAGAIYGTAGLWLIGGVLHLGCRWAGGQGTYRRARHVVGYAAAPLALSLLLVWPVRIAVYGSDLFRSGGSDHGVGNSIFVGLLVAAEAWMLVLVLIGTRAVHSWPWPRALAAAAPAAALVALQIFGSLG